MKTTDISLAEIRFPDGRKLYAAFNTDTDTLVTRSLMPLLPHELAEFDDEVSDLDPAQYLATLHVAKHQMGVQKRDELISLEMPQHMAGSEEVEVYISDYEEGFASRANFAAQVLTGAAVMRAPVEAISNEQLVTRKHLCWAIGGLALSLLPVTFFLRSYGENAESVMLMMWMVDAISVLYIAQPLAFFKADALPMSAVFQKSKEIKYVAAAMFVLGLFGIFFLTQPGTYARDIAGHLTMFGFLFGLLGSFAAYGIQLATSVLKPKEFGSNR